MTETISILSHLLALRDADAKAVANALVEKDNALTKAAELADARYIEIGELRENIQEIAKGMVAIAGKIENTEGRAEARRESSRFVFQAIASIANLAAIIGVLIVLIRGH